MNIDRRFFLKSSGIALASLGAGLSAPAFLRRAAMADTRGGKKILIAIFQRGAADGLNMVVPHAEKAYYNLRPTIAIPRPKSGDVNAAIELDEFFGLHPSLKPFKPLYDAGHLAIIHAVGSPDSTRSHFDAQDFMESATPGLKSTTDGWLNRYLLARPQPQQSAFRAVALSQNLPRTLQGRAPAIAMANINEFGLRGAGLGNPQSSFEALYGQGTNDLLHNTAQEAFEAVKLLRRANPTQFAPASGANYPRGRFGDTLKQIAQLIKADIGLEVAFTDCGGWDTHAGQGGSQGQLANRLTEFSQGIAALYTDLGDRMQDIVILTMSEFGRTAHENGNRGTDHGHANCMFVLGGAVKGGKVYGKWPGLEREQLFEGRDLALTTDFRDVFAEVIARHLGAPDLTKVFPNYQVKTSNFKGFMG